MNSSFAEDRYQLSVDVKGGIIGVHAELNDIAKEEIICLPAFGQRFGEHLIDPKTPGNARELHVDSSGCIRSISQTGSLVFTYTLQMDELTEGHYWTASSLSSVHQNGMLAFSGESLFIERGANNSRSKASTTVVEVSGCEQSMSTLNEAPKAANGVPSEARQTFFSKDRFELTRSYWAFGRFKMLMASSGSITWRLAVDENWQTSVSVIERELSRILEYYSSWIPSKTPENISLFLFSVPFDASYHHGFARPGGIILELGQKAASEAATRRVLMAHELFHLYNGEGLRFDPDKYAETAWFREGITQYMAFRSLLNLGLITREQLYDWMAASIMKQRSNVYDPYHHGFFAGYAIELQWTLFKTVYNMEKFWEYLGSSMQWGFLHTNKTIQSLLTTYSAFDFETFFNKYIPIKSQLPITELLKLNGLKKSEHEQLVYTTGLEYEFEPKQAVLKVKNVVPRSPAAQAGIRKGDILIPEKDIDWQDGSDKHLTIIRGSQRLQIRLPATPQIVRQLTITRI